MKKLFFGSLLAVCTLFMTSCLEGGSNSSTGEAFGIIKLSNSKVIINSVVGPVYSPEIANRFTKGDIDINDCCWFYYEMDRDLPENSNEAIAKNGYYTVTVSQYLDIDKAPVYPSLQDTAVVIPSELPIVGIDGRYSTFLATKGDKMFFLGTILDNVAKEQKQEFTLSYDADQKPEVINGEDVYNLFIRVVKKDDGKQGSSSQLFINAFNLNRFVADAQYKEEQKGKKSLKFRFNFVSELDKDKTKATWKASDVVTYLFPTEEK